LPLTHRHLVAPVLAFIEPQRAERERQPAEIVGKADRQNDPAGNRSDCGADKRNVVAGRRVVVPENRLPAIVAGFTGEYWRVEIHLHPASSGAPDIEVAITSRLHAEKDGN